ncbi:class I SAM-dependent methyltransferase [Catenovulum sp. SX2]|uniref:class I SAM-dependent methyltransferase n=1 Tax=Catenovulum sp. SX2 TaxID=3398614 RepID=UPI003F872AFA
MLVDCQSKTTHSPIYGQFTLTPMTKAKQFVDASVYPVVDHSGQAAWQREQDPHRFVEMAACANGFSQASEWLVGKRILDVGCGGGQITHLLAVLAKAVWALDPDINNPRNPIHTKLHPNYLIDLTIQQALTELPELKNQFDLVTSFAPHPFPLSTTLTESIFQQSEQYYQAMIDCCKSGGDLMVMPVYQRDLGLKNGFIGLINMLQPAFKKVTFSRVALQAPKEHPFFAIFINAQHKYTD